VELKNDISIRGTLKSVDQFLNIKLDEITVVEELKYPHLVSPPLNPCFSFFCYSLFAGYVRTAAASSYLRCVRERARKLKKGWLLAIPPPPKKAIPEGPPDETPEGISIEDISCEFACANPGDSTDGVFCSSYLSLACFLVKGWRAGFWTRARTKRQYSKNALLITRLEAEES